MLESEGRRNIIVIVLRYVIQTVFTLDAQARFPSSVLVGH